MNNGLKMMTLQEICEEIGAKETSVRKALDWLNIRPSRADLTDRRRLVYPPGTSGKVKDWLLQNAEF